MKNIYNAINSGDVVTMTRKQIRGLLSAGAAQSLDGLTIPEISAKIKEDGLRVVACSFGASGITAALVVSNSGVLFALPARFLFLIKGV